MLVPSLRSLALSTLMLCAAAQDIRKPDPSPFFHITVNTYRLELVFRVKCRITPSYSLDFDLDIHERAQADIIITNASGIAVRFDERVLYSREFVKVWTSYRKQPVMRFDLAVESEPLQDEFNNCCYGRLEMQVKINDDEETVDPTVPVFMLHCLKDGEINTPTHQTGTHQIQAVFCTQAGRSAHRSDITEKYCDDVGYWDTKKPLTVVMSVERWSDREEPSIDFTAFDHTTLVGIVEYKDGGVIIEVGYDDRLRRFSDRWFLNISACCRISMRQQIWFSLTNSTWQMGSTDGHRFCAPLEDAHASPSCKFRPSSLASSTDVKIAIHIFLITSVRNRQERSGHHSQTEEHRNRMTLLSAVLGSLVACQTSHKRRALTASAAASLFDPEGLRLLNITYSGSASCSAAGMLWLLPPASVRVEISFGAEKPLIGFAPPVAYTSVGIASQNETGAMIELRLKRHPEPEGIWELFWHSDACCSIYLFANIWLSLTSDSHKQDSLRVYRVCSPLSTADATEECRYNYVTHGLDPYADCDMSKLALKIG
ncbi:hypothetical protein E5Q_03251 [Mixia osmundae IAM 14324]|uniref:Uncharacterized protein n=1 Tax=Mixia osmundae (strain CBS 9802 / IAM 14324 / JCM 22182 / KY 12970) TaxID=764103 RepID=G7E171_MIXOS|nr:hypothetical protein E5Q_03251 [Mixia osmundae IAM 14324]